MTLPYNFWEASSTHQKYVPYGDSVCENSYCMILTNDIKSYVTFNDIWYWLSNQFKVIKSEDKEYIYFNQNPPLKILSYNETLDRLEFKTPEYLMRHYITDDVVRLNISNFDYLDVTNYHSLLDYDGQKLIKILPKDAEYLPIICPEINISDTLDFQYYLLGLWIPYGEFSKDYKQYPSLNISNYKEVVDYLKSQYSDHQSYRSTLQNLITDMEIEECDSDNRLISMKLMGDLQNNLDHFMSFFGGYYTSSGQFKNGSILITSNVSILSQLRYLLTYHNIYSYISSDQKFLIIPKIGCNLYEFILKFQNIIDSKMEDLNPEQSLSYGLDPITNNTIVSDINYIKIKDIAPIKVNAKYQYRYEGYVYDFSVPETQNFVVNGFLVHNTDSIYINVPQIIPTDPQDAIVQADNISRDVNKIIDHTVLSDLLPKMGIRPEHNSIMFKTELVCDALLLLDVKKNYAYRLIAKEGKALKTPTVKYTNLTVVKSDTAPFTKEFLECIVEKIIMNPENRKKNLIDLINTLAIEMRGRINKCLVDLEFSYIAIPKKWGTGYSNDSVPWQVIAAQLYNTITDTQTFKPMSAFLIIDINIVNPVEFESKIAAVKNKHKLYIGNIPINKLTKLAIPYSLNKPEFRKILEYYNIEFDINVIWDTLFNKTCRRIIDVVRIQK